MKSVLFPPEFLDSIFDKWIRDRNKGYSVRYKRNYQRESRRYNEVFETWLWENGFTVIQDNHKRYLKFTGDEKKLTLFLLKNNITG